MTLVCFDGTTERRTLRTHDWFDDPGPESESETGALTPDATPLLNGMDRMRQGKFENCDDPALFETSFEVDPRRMLAAFILEAPEMIGRAPETPTQHLRGDGSVDRRGRLIAASRPPHARRRGEAASHLLPEKIDRVASIRSQRSPPRA